MVKIHIPFKQNDTNTAVSQISKVTASKLDRNTSTLDENPEQGQENRIALRLFLLITIIY